MAVTPVYSFPYLTLGDAPHIPNLGQNGFTAVENKIITIDADIAAVEADVATRAVAPLRARRTSDNPITSQATPQADAQLVVTPSINTIYDVEVILFVTGATAGDLAVRFAFAATNARLDIGVAGPNELIGSATDANADTWRARTAETTSPSNTFRLGTPGTTIDLTVIFKGTLDMGATAGNFQVQWSQLTSNATATTVRRGSRMRLDPW